MGRLNRASDSAGFTKARDVVTAAHTVASEVRYLEFDGLAEGGPLEHLARTLVRGETPAGYLRSDAGRRFFERLVEHRVVAAPEAAAYADPGTRELHAGGRVALERDVYALAFDDPEVLATAPAALLAALAGALPVLLRLRVAPAWDLARPVGGALRLLGWPRRQAAERWPGVHTLDDVLRQLRLFDGDGGRAVPEAVVDRELLADPRTVALARFLAGAGPRQSALAAAFAAWWKQADAYRARDPWVPAGFFDVDAPRSEVQQAAARAAFARIFAAGLGAPLDVAVVARAPRSPPPTRGWARPGGASRTSSRCTASTRRR